MKHSSDNDSNHKFLDIFDSIKSALTIGDSHASGEIKEKGEQSLDNIPVLKDIVDTPATNIELDDLDAFDDYSNTGSFIKEQPEESEIDIQDSDPDIDTTTQATSIDELLSQLFAIDNNTDIEASNYKSKELIELMQMEAEQIREEILAEFLPRMEQSFKERLQDATSEILGELIERRMQARLKGYK